MGGRTRLWVFKQAAVRWAYRFNHQLKEYWRRGPAGASWHTYCEHCKWPARINVKPIRNQAKLEGDVFHKFCIGSFDTTVAKVLVPPTP